MLTSSRLISWLGGGRERERFELTHHGGKQLGDGRMYVHRTLQHSIGRPGLHKIQDTVNHFIAGESEKGCADD